MAKYTERIKARGLRRAGYSLGDIATQLKVSKSSVSMWCRDIEMTEEQQQLLRDYVIKKGHKGRMIAVQRNKKKKQDRISFWNKNGRKEFSNLSNRELVLAGACLYWAEGSKTKSSFGFTNSDPYMILFVKHWLTDGLGIDLDRIAPRIQINHIHKPRIGKVLNFWVKLLELPSERFLKTSYVKTRNTKVYANYDNYYGTMVLQVRKSSGVLYKILGQIQALKKIE